MCSSDLSGSWGTVISQVLVDAGSETVLWSRNAEIANAINTEHRNPFYLDEFELPAGLASTTEADLRGSDSGSTVAAATKIGQTVAQRAKAAGISKVVYDRGGYLYHGRVAAVAEAAREAGLEF